MKRFMVALMLALLTLGAVAGTALADPNGPIITRNGR